MITFSAFADEIDPDLKTQMDACEANGIKCIDVRSLNTKNVSVFTVQEAAEYRKQLDDRGFTVPCIGSPIGKIKISDDFDAHLEKFKHCCDIAKTFGTSQIRIFSFYPSDGVIIADQRSEVIDRLAALLAVAEAADVVLLHENESNIYGARPDNIKDLFATLKSDHFRGVFDPANFVIEGLAPYDEAWTEGLVELTQLMHIKDKDPTKPACVPAGEGDGQFLEIFADLKKRRWSGYMTLEPHLAEAGQFGGFTGAELFARAVNALKRLCDKTGLEYE